MTDRRVLVLMAMLLLQASDLASTVYALQSPEVRELNPLLAGGFPAMLAAKLFCALLLAVVLFRSFVHATEGEEELDEIFGGIFGGSAEDGAHSVCHGGVEDNRAHLNPGEIDTHLLASLQHGYTSDSATISARQS